MKIDLIRLISLSIISLGILNNEVSASSLHSNDSLKLVPQIDKEYKLKSELDFNFENSKSSTNSYYKLNDKLLLQFKSNIEKFPNNNIYDFKTWLNYKNFTLTGLYKFETKDINQGFKDYGIGLSYIYKNAIVNLGYKQKNFEEYRESKDNINSDILFSVKAGYNINDNFITYAEASLNKVTNDKLQQKDQKFNKEKTVLLMIGTKVNF